MAFPGASSRLKRALSALAMLVMAAVWFLAGKRIRARNRWREVFPLNDFEARNLRRAREICARQDAVSAAEEAAMRQDIAAMANPPLISVVMPVYETVESDLRAAIRSVREQIYPHWELCIADDASPGEHVRRILGEEAAAEPRIKVVHRSENGHISKATNSALELATGAFVALMDHDDTLPRHALYHVARAIVDKPDVDFLYSDEDKIVADGRLDGPHFKPDWNEELLLAQNYINHLAVYRTDILKRIGGLRDGFEGSQDHDLVLRFFLETDASRIVHIPLILYHWRAYHGSGSFSDRAIDRAIDARRRAARDYLARRRPGLQATVERGPHGCNRIERALPDPAPKVTIIIPTRDQRELLEACLTSIFRKTAYPDFDVIIVDNQSTDPALFALYERLKAERPVRVIAYDAPFNYSAINNLAVAEADGDVVALLNNDIEVIAPEWLGEMVAYAVQPEVGAVGAKLIYGDNTIQHAGVVLGVGGIANHAHHLYDARDAGYQARLHLPHYVSAVTGACLVVDKAKYRAVGGLDEDKFKIAFNDIDFCLKLADTGLFNVYTPYARLYHHESRSRGADVTPQKAARLEAESAIMRKKWGAWLERDPYYNPNFSRDNARFEYRAGSDEMSRVG